MRRMCHPLPLLQVTEICILFIYFTVTNFGFKSTVEQSTGETDSDFSALFAVWHWSHFGKFTNNWGATEGVRGEREERKGREREKGEERKKEEGEERKRGEREKRKRGEGEERKRGEGEEGDGNKKKRELLAKMSPEQKKMLLDRMNKKK